MTITYSMKNATPQLAKTIMLRKFFQMVFVGEDRKSLHIYTATVIGASSQEYKPSDGYSDFVSDFSNLKSFRVQFEFTVSGNDTNDVDYIQHKDITAQDHGLLTEIECIRKVWGDNCEIIYNSQEKLSEKLKECGPDSTQESPEDCSPLVKYKILWTTQTKNSVDSKLLQSLSLPGQIHFDKPLGQAEKSSYTIDVPEDVSFVKGIELLNWVKTTIQFKHTLDDTNLNYSIQRIPPTQTADEKYLHVIAPDFTWYFSPPVKSFIDHRNSMVETKQSYTAPQGAPCTCPYNKEKSCLANFDKYPSGVSPVSNKTTVDFHYWTKDEQIRSRQKYRLAAKDILQTPTAFNEIEEINIFLDTADEHNRGNRQFILGLFISFALAFGIDSSRLDAVKGFFLWPNYIPADVCWLIFLVLYSLILLMKPPRFSNQWDRRLLVVRNCSIVVSLLWIFCVFVLGRSAALQAVIQAHINVLQTISMWTYGILVLVDIGYIAYLRIKYHDRIFVGLFGEDIL